MEQDMPESPDVIKDPPIAPPTDKPGYATTEFWLTLSSTILSFVTALLAITTPGFSLDPTISAAVAAFAPVAAMIGNGLYALSRARTKQATAQIAIHKMDYDYDREQKRKAWEIEALYEGQLEDDEQSTVHDEILKELAAANTEIVRLKKAAGVVKKSR